MIYFPRKTAISTFISSLSLCFFFSFTLSTPASAQDKVDEPEELVRLKHSYNQRINAERAKYDAMFDAAVAPLNQTYIQHLQQMKDRFMRQNNPSAAMAVQSELDKQSILKSGIYTLVVYNSNFRNRGARRFDITLYDGNSVVWERKNIRINWKAEQAIKHESKLPDVVFDRIRIAITEWEGVGGGLSEIQLLQNNINLITEKAIVTASDFYGRNNTPDSITSQENNWILPNNQAGWIDIKLGK